MTITRIICETKTATDMICREVFGIALSMAVYPDAHEITVTSYLTPRDIVRHLDNCKISDRIYQIEAM